MSKEPETPQAFSLAMAVGFEFEDLHLPVPPGSVNPLSAGVRTVPFVGPASSSRPRCQPPRGDPRARRSGTMEDVPRWGRMFLAGVVGLVSGDPQAVERSDDVSHSAQLSFDRMLCRKMAATRCCAKTLLGQHGSQRFASRRIQRIVSHHWIDIGDHLSRHQVPIGLGQQPLRVRLGRRNLFQLARFDHRLDRRRALWPPSRISHGRSHPARSAGATSLSPRTSLIHRPKPPATAGEC